MITLVTTINWTSWDSFWKSIVDLISNTNISELSVLNLVIIGLVLWILFLLVKFLWKHFFKPGLVAIKNGFYNLSHNAKRKCSKITCKKCGRTLDKCICESNKNLSYNQRLRKYYKEQRALKKAAKAAAKEAASED